MRFCLVYDCLFPHTVGGAERWYRVLASELLGRGHEVTYLTRRQWDAHEAPDATGMRVVAVSRPGPLYTPDGRRRIVPPLEFGGGVLRHLAAHRDAYDVVHGGNFPFFSVIAMRAALAGSRVRVGIDWHEAWSARYWETYLGGPGGAAGHAIQRLCVHLTPRAFVFSEMNARRLREEGYRGDVVKLPGLYHGAGSPAPAGEEDARAPLLLYAGRLIPEKRAHLVPAAVRAARERVPGLRAVIVGDGPERERVRAAIADDGVEDVVEARGFVSDDELHDLLRRATCLLLPSAREGYGMIVIEAAAAGTPSVVVAGEDNAAPELVEEGRNGFVARSPDALGDAVVAVHEDGAALRERTRLWFAEHADRVSAVASARVVAEAYE